MFSFIIHVQKFGVCLTVRATLDDCRLWCELRCRAASRLGPPRGWGRGVNYSGPRDVRGPHRRSEIYKVRQSVPFWKEKF